MSDRASFLLAGARLVDPSSGTDVVADLAVVDGMLAEPSPHLRRLDGRGLVVAPGLCDLRASLAPDLDDAAAVADLARSAARGGYTTVCLASSPEGPFDDPARVAHLRALGAAGGIRVRVVGAMTRGGAGEQLADLRALADASMAGVSDGAIRSAALTRAALLYLAPLELPLIVRAQEPSLAGGALVRTGRVSTRLGLSGWPPSAEVVVVERDLALAAETGGWVHFSRISTAGALDGVRRARSNGVRVTCDVATSHLSLWDGWVAGDRRFAWEVADDGGPFARALDPDLAYDAACRTDPPLPSLTDARALLAGVADGTVDALVSDHTPQPPQRKLVEFAGAAPGMIGLQTSLSLGLAAVEAGAMELPALLAALSSRPAALVGERRTLTIGSRADLVVFDPVARWVVEREALESVHANTPLLGRELPGVVRLTIADGRITHDDLLG
jgi:dihydroorotase